MLYIYLWNPSHFCFSWSKTLTDMSRMVPEIEMGRHSRLYRLCGRWKKQWKTNTFSTFFSKTNLQSCHCREARLVLVVLDSKICTARVCSSCTPSWELDPQCVWLDTTQDEFCWMLYGAVDCAAACPQSMVAAITVPPSVFCQTQSTCQSKLTWGIRQEKTSPKDGERQWPSLRR